ncbi:NAD(P)H-hydrate dehydratase [Fodinibius sediminis]|uniref:Bifunctional NAD(P)H-hydrate repair enzyme n=1 Tax=Fodinibius sediminis TaxID=1214077 RepID=A0A521DIM5_9BACT|nr:NAD(P)H-hydrate dehydratase [Fodinibius sediminis]SMO71468.1 NAD(P)H-hydrate epimerase [Fodinibius sediminis]
MLNATLPHYLFTASQSREIDRRTIEETGMDGFTLMEIAGLSAAKHLLGSDINLSHGVYLCGKGNNGGDAMVVARYLLQNEIAATLVFLSGTDNLSPDAQRNLELLQQFDDHHRIEVYESWDTLEQTEHWDFIIDGMLGTGLDSNLRGDYLEAVHWANEQDLPVASMDIPTGLHADTGQLMGACIEADYTFAFGGRKQGLYLEEGPFQTGSVLYCELPFPNSYKARCDTFLLDESWVSLEQARPGRHKYASGVLYLIAGSEGLTGAAMLAARSAWAEGLGAVILVCPRGLLPVYEIGLPSIIKKAVGNKSDDFFKPDHLPEVLDILEEKEGAVLLGPGIGRQDDTVAFINRFLPRNPRNTVIDADGLWALAQWEQWEKPRGSQWILTPHPGELSRFSDKPIKSDAHRLHFVRNFSSRRQLTILSKGMPGIIGTSSGECYLTNYDTRYFSRAGSGDVLAGKVGASLARGRAPDASCAEGLLRGKKKLDHYLTNADDLPEPRDFI